MRSWFRTPHPRDTDVDISSVEFWSRPFEARDIAFAGLRRTRPVSWHLPLETPGLSRRHQEAGFWAVTKVEDIARVSRHPELFSSEIGQVGVRPAPFRLEPNMLVVDPPLHTALRGIVSRAFSTSSLAALEHQIDHHAKQIVARAALENSFDYVSGVAAKLPLKTVANLIGVPESEEGSFIEAANAHVTGGIPGRLAPEAGRSHYFAEQTAYLSGLCLSLAQWRRRQPGDDLMTKLVEARVEGRPLPDEAIRSTVLLLVVAGDDTTKQAITLSLLALAQFPEQRDYLLDAFEERFDTAFEELVRFASPVISFARTATEDLELNGASITSGDKVALFYCSGNRDETEFPHPERLELTRDSSSQVGFGGGGVHFCLGNRLARAQVKAILRETYARMPDLELGEPEFGFGESVHSVISLPVRQNR